MCLPLSGAPQIAAVGSQSEKPCMASNLASKKLIASVGWEAGRRLSCCTLEARARAELQGDTLHANDPSHEEALTGAGPQDTEETEESDGTTSRLEMFQTEVSDFFGLPCGDSL